MASTGSGLPLGLWEDFLRALGHPLGSHCDVLIAVIATDMTSPLLKWRVLKVGPEAIGLCAPARPPEIVG